MTILPFISLSVNWTQIIIALIGFLGGGSLLTIIMEWRYRKLNKKTKTAKSSSESYLDYEKVIDSSTVRLEKLRNKIDRLYEAIDLIKKSNGVLRMKLFEYRQFIKTANLDENLRAQDRFTEFFKVFDSDEGLDVFDIDGHKNVKNETGKETEQSVQTRNNQETS